MNPLKAIILIFCLGSNFYASNAFSVAQREADSSRAIATPHFLYTPHLWLTTARMINASASFETRSHWHAPLSGIVGTLQRWSYLRFDLGVANNVTLQIRGAIQQQLRIDTNASSPFANMPFSGTTRDAGDFSIATIIRLYSREQNQTAFGFRAETKLPNTTQSKGLGPNTTDIYLSVLASHRMRALLLFGDVGIGILTAPRELDAQNDVLSYGLGASFRLTRSVNLAAEINGYLTTRNVIPLGTEARGVARAGLSWRLRALQIEAALAHGLTANEGDWGASVGVARAVRF